MTIRPRPWMVPGKVEDWKVLTFKDRNGNVHHVLLGEVSTHYKRPKPNCKHLYASRREDGKPFDRHIGSMVENSNMVEILYVTPENFGDLPRIRQPSIKRKKDAPKTGENSSI
jgi:hypothetical protein